MRRPDQTANLQHSRIKKIMVHMIIRLTLYYIYSFTFKHSSFLNLKLHYYICTLMLKTTSHKVVQSILQV